MAVYDVRCAQKAAYDQPADIHPLLLSHSHSYSRCLTVTMSAGGITVCSGSLLLSLAGRTNGFVQQVCKGKIFWIVLVFLAWGGVEELNYNFFCLVLHLNEVNIYALQIFHGCDTCFYHISKHSVHASNIEGSVCSESVLVVNVWYNNT